MSGAYPRSAFPFLVMRDSLFTVVVGTMIGGALAWGGYRLITGLLFGIEMMPIALPFAAGTLLAFSTIVWVAGSGPGTDRVRMRVHRKFSEAFCRMRPLLVPQTRSNWRELSGSGML